MQLKLKNCQRTFGSLCDRHSKEVREKKHKEQGLGKGPLLKAPYQKCAHSL